MRSANEYVLFINYITFATVGFIIIAQKLIRDGNKNLCSYCTNFSKLFIEIIEFVYRIPKRYSKKNSKTNTNQSKFFNKHNNINDYLCFTNTQMRSKVISFDLPFK